MDGDPSQYELDEFQQENDDDEEMDQEEDLPNVEGEEGLVDDPDSEPRQLTPADLISDEVLEDEDEEEQLVFDTQDQDQDQDQLEDEENENDASLEDNDTVPRSLSLEDDLFSTDAASLYDPALGFEDVSNIKQPLAGYSDTDQNEFFPLIDEQSGILFDIVQNMEGAYLKCSEDALLQLKRPVAIPTNRLVVGEGGPEVRLRVVDRLQEEDKKMIMTQANNAARESERAVPEKMLAAIVSAKDAFSPEKLAMLLRPLELGWKREIVMRSHGGGASKKLGDVYYFSPEGTKFRSSKQVALFLSKHPKLGMTIENYSFAKARVSYNPDQESVRQAYGGRGAAATVSPPAKVQHHRSPAPVVMNVSNVSVEEEENGVESDGEGQAVKARGGRRSIQPPKRYATGESVFYPENKRAKVSSKANQEKEMDHFGSMEMGMLPPKYRMEEPTTKQEGMTGEEMFAEYRRRGRPPKPGGKKDLIAQADQMKAAKSAAGSFGHQNEDDGALFGISAFTQSAQFGQLDYNDYSQYGQGGQGQEYEGTGGTGGGGGDSQGKQELLPCSIRCPGMTGEIPTLQCRRCLCLYHPGCLGLPNQNYRNFFCANCEGEPNESAGGSGSGPLRQGMKGPQRGRPMMGQMGGMRRSSPPPLIQLSRGGMASFRGVPGRRILPKMPGFPGPYAGQRGQGPGPSMMMGQRSRMEMGRGGMNPPIGRILRRPDGSEIRPGMSVSSIDMRRGRGRPPRNMMGPQLNHRSLTITPISIPRRGGLHPHPVVPKLQPMSGLRPGPGGMQRRPIQLPFPNSGIRGMQLPPSQGGKMLQFGTGIAPKRPTHILARPRLPPNPNRPQLHPGAQNQNQGGQGLRSSLFRMDPATGRVVPLVQKDFKQSANYKRYAQSVVTINQKKFIAVPKKPLPSLNQNQAQQLHHQQQQQQLQQQNRRLQLQNQLQLRQMKEQELQDQMQMDLEAEAEAEVDQIEGAGVEDEEPVEPEEKEEPETEGLELGVDLNGAEEVEGEAATV